MAHAVFVSHSDKDKEIAAEIVRLLEEAGFLCWIAPRDIESGEAWDEAIVRAIETSKAMVLVFSENANHSKWVRREIHVAVDGDLPIIPFKIEDAPLASGLKLALNVTHWMDATSLPLEDHAGGLIARLRKIVPDGVRSSQQVREGPAGAPRESGMEPEPTSAVAAGRRDAPASPPELATSTRVVDAGNAIGDRPDARVSGRTGSGAEEPGPGAAPGGRGTPLFLLIAGVASTATALAIGGGYPSEVSVFSDTYERQRSAEQWGIILGAVASFAVMGLWLWRLKWWRTPSSLRSGRGGATAVLVWCACPALGMYFGGVQKDPVLGVALGFVAPGLFLQGTGPRAQHLGGRIALAVAWPGAPILFSAVLNSAGVKHGSSFMFLVGGVGNVLSMAWIAWLVLRAAKRGVLEDDVA